ncbi:MAG TPA: PqqD family peptide modification chaperone [Pyrinomonadaceae bacterium]|nr:PqqD family peptide modification chaperone [Pyrinomonadaceae bacterium]
MTNQPNSRKANIVVQDLENEVLIYDLNINKAFCLNQTAGLVYQFCDGRRTFAEISDLMSKELKTLVSKDFVWLALDGLKKDGLLENADELANHFG